MAAHTLTTRSPTASTPSTAVRTEIQALRAAAVLGVLVYHLWPGRLPGGFVGVDVFFVVSGFLITDHILREVERSGTVRVVPFWARRMRRLLPASLLVLVVTALAVWWLVPDGRWAQFGGEIVASALYVENWALAAQSVDYMALSNIKSPVQHFWSLSVEEQFYVVWPLLVLLSIVLAGRRRTKPVRVIALTLGAVTVISFVLSVVVTAAQPDVAYFATYVRAWEFGAGALLALALRHRAALGGPRVSAVTSWLGFVAILVSMLTFSDRTPFPSWTALLPVIGTLAVIAAGASRSPLAPTRLFQVRPIQFVGDVSYGAYLWHWPILVLLPYLTGGPLNLPQSGAVLLSSIALGWASKRFVEDPARNLRLIARAPAWRTVLATGVAMSLVIAIAWPLAGYRVQPPASLAPSEQPACYGALATADPACGDPERIPLRYSLSSFSIDVPPQELLACEYSTPMEDYRRCDYGDLTGAGPHVALVGDSHATRLVEPIRDAVLAAGGSLSTFVVSGCAMMTNQLTGSVWGFEPVYAEQCRSISERALDAVAADPGIDTVLLTNRTRLWTSTDPSVRPLTEEMVEATISDLQAAGKRAIVVKDPPETNAVPPQSARSAVDCLAAAANVAECSLPRQATVFDDPMVAAAQARNADVIDVDAAMCTDERCEWQVGGLVVYSDDNHLSRSFARSLASRFSDDLARLGVTPY